jgi:hypothetical protein
MSKTRPSQHRGEFRVSHVSVREITRAAVRQEVVPTAIELGKVACIPRPSWRFKGAQADARGLLAKSTAYTRRSGSLPAVPGL